MIERLSAARRRALLALVVALLTAWSVGVGSPGAAAARTVLGHASVPSTGRAQAPRAATDNALRIRLTGVDPVVATPGRPVAVQVSVTNAGDVPIAPVRVQIRLGSGSALLTRSQVRAHASTARVHPSDDLVAGTSTPGALLPGTTVPLAMSIPGRSIPRARNYGVFPVTLTATANEDSASLSSFLPYQAVKEYVPLSIAFAAPLTLDPDPELVTATGPERLVAWNKAIGAGSRIDRVLSGTQAAPVTWVVDPALLGLQGGPASSGDTSGGGRIRPSPRAGPADPDATTSLQQSLIDRLAAQTPRHPVWALPSGDPDLTALVDAGADSFDLSSRLAGDSGLASTLSVPGVARIAWPTGHVLGRSGRQKVTRAFAGAGPTVTLVPASSVGADPRLSESAPRRTAAGEPLLAYDDELSRLFAATGQGSSGSEVTQRFLAETVTLLAESPGRRRTILVAAPRTFDPDVTQLRGFFANLAAAPWVEPTPTTPLLSAAASPGTAAAQPLAGMRDPLSAGPSPLTHQVVHRLGETRREIAGMSRVLTPTSTSRLVPDLATVEALFSTRWRGASADWASTDAAVQARIRTLTTGVSVVPSTINFFADHGSLQVTVVNNLDVDVHDVRLVLTSPARPPRLRIVQEPSPLTIRARSRTTVRVRVEAVAAGLVPVSAHLATPADTRLGSDATVRVRVQPTNGWVMLAIGSLVGVVFVAGLYRALRAGSPRVSSEDLKEIDLE